MPENSELVIAVNVGQTEIDVTYRGVPGDHFRFEASLPENDLKLMEGYIARKHGALLPRWHRYSNRWPRIFTPLRVAYLRMRYSRGAESMKAWGR